MRSCSCLKCRAPRRSCPVVAGHRLSVAYLPSCMEDDTAVPCWESLQAALSGVAWSCGIEDDPSINGWPICSCWKDCYLPRRFYADNPNRRGLFPAPPSEEEAPYGG